ncbi:MAG: NAD-binding oxidoreductase [Rhizobiales bacterium 65-9]|nr:Gfo/Idh/MocA family oxidoreductase [Hyphomicrobiales bacterium]OJY35023.1 MAG: NAD-binding oxidoreductase [Rhizobiales bacterium 65-9]
MSRLRLAVIGAGPAVEPHAKSLLDLFDRVEVVAVASRSVERTQAFAKKFPLPVSTDIDGLIADPSIQAIILLTPPNAHLAVAERCFAHGKHVLVEKPIDVTAERGQRMVDAARRAGRTLGVVLQHRFREASLRLRRRIDEGALGEIAWAAMAAPWWRPQSYYDEPGRGTYARDGGGVLITQAIHTIDLFRSLVGVSKVDSAQVARTPLHRMEGEDLANALVRLRNGAPGVIQATTAFFPGSPERIEIIGTKASAVLGGGALTITDLTGAKEVVEAEGGTGAGANIMDFPHDAHRALIADFIDAVERGRPPLVSGEEALETQLLIEAILAAGDWRRPDASGPTT